MTGFNTLFKFTNCKFGSRLLYFNGFYKWVGDIYILIQRLLYNSGLLYKVHYLFSKSSSLSEKIDINLLDILSENIVESIFVQSKPALSFFLQELSGLTLAELKVELSPRISGADLVELLSTKFSRPKVFVVDVREHQEYPFVIAKFYTSQ